MTALTFIVGVSLKSSMSHYIFGHDDVQCTSVRACRCTLLTC